MKGKGRKKLRKQLKNDARLDKQAEHHKEKRAQKTERWAGGIRPAAYGKPPLKKSYTPKGLGKFKHGAFDAL